MEAAPNYRSIRNRYVFGLCGLAALWGTQNMVLVAPPDSIRVLTRLAFGTGMALLVAADSRILGKALPQTSLWLFVFAWPFTVPGYVISTRGKRGVWLLIKYGGLLIGISFATMLSIAILQL